MPRFDDGSTRTEVLSISEASDLTRQKFTDVLDLQLSGDRMKRAQDQKEHEKRFLDWCSLYDTAQSRRTRHATRFNVVLAKHPRARFCTIRAIREVWRSLVVLHSDLIDKDKLPWDKNMLPDAMYRDWQNNLAAQLQLLEEMGRRIEGFPIKGEEKDLLDQFRASFEIVPDPLTDADWDFDE